MKRIVIIGATSAIAEHCARLWVEEAAVDITLVGRDAGRVERVAKDLRVRSPQSRVHASQVDFVDPAGIDAAVDDITSQGDIDVVLIAHGSLPEQAQCQDDLSACRTAIEVNALSPVLFAEAFARRMASAGKGTLALIGSVAGDRGRKSNYVYGSAKGLVTLYAQGLQHRFARSGVKVVLIKPGPTDTPMTMHLQANGAKLAPVTQVARAIVDAVARGRRVVYAPAKWHWIMWVIRLLPFAVFSKLDI